MGFKGCDDVRILVRGGGDIATGIAHRLFKSGFRVFITEISRPMCVRRKVAFCEAVYDGKTEVEGVTARLAEDPEEAVRISNEGIIPILIDEKAKSIKTIKPLVVVDAIMAKKNLGLSMKMAPIVIGVGPGFHAGVDCHAVIETMRGHDLGRVITKGKARDNTGVPGDIMGFSRKRVIYAPVSGVIKLVHDIGDMVREGEVIAKINDVVVTAPIRGVLRGIIRNGFNVIRGMKIGDVDPRGVVEHCFTISDKARAVGGGVLEAVLYLMRSGSQQDTKNS